MCRNTPKIMCIASDGPVAPAPTAARSHLPRRINLTKCAISKNSLAHGSRSPSFPNCPRIAPQSHLCRMPDRNLAVMPRCLAVPTDADSTTYMKKLLFVIVIVVVLTVLGIASKNASATTGGPRYVSRLGYDSAAKTLYYVVNDMGGRGCPPVIHKLNLPSGMRGTVASCDELEAGKTVDIEAF